MPLAHLWSDWSVPEADLDPKQRWVCTNVPCSTDSMQGSLPHPHQCLKHVSSTPNKRRENTRCKSKRMPKTHPDLPGQQTWHWGQRGSYLVGKLRVFWEFVTNSLPICPVGKFWTKLSKNPGGSFKGCLVGNLAGFFWTNLQLTHWSNWDQSGE